MFFYSCFNVTLFSSCLLLLTFDSLFYFPFKGNNSEKEKAYNEIFAKISNLQYPLLFISNLESIKWKTQEDKNGIYKKEITNTKNINNTLIEKITLNNNNNTRKDLFGEKTKSFILAYPEFRLWHWAV